MMQRQYFTLILLVMHMICVFPNQNEISHINPEIKSNLSLKPKPKMKMKKLIINAIKYLGMDLHCFRCIHCCKFYLMVLIKSIRLMNELSYTCNNILLVFEF